jgi:hypothetical protein
MNRRPSRIVTSAALAYLAALLCSEGSAAQSPVQAPRATPTPQSSAAVDLTGDWVSVVTGDWKYRMVTPPKGVYDGIPLSAEGRRIADGWNPTQDTASGEQCRAYGAANVMRIPGRVRIHWEGADTLRIDTDAGTQTRLLKFGADTTTAPSWQGRSHAEWQQPVESAPGTGGSLKVVTTQLKPGYLRKNGAPYSDATVLTEYYERITAPNGDTWLVLTQIVKDPKYLSRPYITSTNFKKVADGAGWNPQPCSAT